ncbi:hypothetical protein K450DRAFT_232464 [Umbelopsis ramanniana AG]|uniref:RNA-binding protein n=1 Tax=Umbelopsis ramanniana AG TaxID=1314678 RepID=A0AAD5EDB3_UMBRA|nr:uncharacterized protein K450DRAFT_232464 [Umbelopsis ramanniana AG]KAI8581317.1 hypothetical protein K450DRAFT_232464 [Umbelopsis ramanniana AG]
MHPREHPREHSRYPPRRRSRSPHSRYSPPPHPRSGSHRYDDRSGGYDRYDDRPHYGSQHPRDQDRHFDRWDDGRDAWRENPRHDNHYRGDDRHRRPERKEEGLSAPNINIVLRGLPDHFGEQDIEKALVDMEASIDQVTLIKDRETGESRKFAFVKFTSVGHAEEFVTKNYPFIYMDRQRVRIDFSRKEAKQEGAGWRCVKCGKVNDEMRRNCLECRMVNPNPSLPVQRPTDPETFAINDGLRDISALPSHLLLIRGLDQLTTKDTILNIFADSVGFRRALLIRERLTQMSSGFAFLEFWKPADATRALSKIGNRVKVDSATTTLTYGEVASFLPAYVSSQWTIPSHFAGGLSEYRDPSLYCEIVEITPPAESENTSHEVIRTSTEETKQKSAPNKEEDDLDAFYADMNSILDEDDDEESIFSVPKSMK